MAMSCVECGGCDQFHAGTKKKDDLCPYPSKRKEFKKKATFNSSGSKYLRFVPCVVDGGLIDVYAVIDAFNVTCPARQHALKKLLCSGIRGKGSVLQDLSEARDAVTRSIQMEEARQAHNNEEEM